MSILPPGGQAVFLPYLCLVAEEDGFGVSDLKRGRKLSRNSTRRPDFARKKVKKK